VDDLPGALFRAKDACSPQREWGDVLPFTNFGLVSLYLHNVGKLRSYVLRYGLDANLAMTT